MPIQWEITGRERLCRIPVKHLHDLAAADLDLVGNRFNIQGSQGIGITIPIVGIQKYHKLSPCRVQRAVAGGGHALIRLGNHLDPPILRGVCRQHRRRIVDGSVVNADHLDFLKRLSEYRIKALGHKSPHVIDRDYH